MSFYTQHRKKNHSGHTVFLLKNGSFEKNPAARIRPPSPTKGYPETLDPPYFSPPTPTSIQQQQTMGSFESFRQRAEDMMSDVYALYLARNDPRIPWYAKAVIVLTVLYALSPIDLIPDFIPFFGYLDDLIIVPLGIALAIWLMPENVWAEYREMARAGFADIRLNSWEGVLLILFIMVGLWKILAIGLVTFMIGVVLMVIFYVFTPAGLLNWGTFIVALGIFILLIAMLKFRRNLKNWKNKVQCSQGTGPGSQ
jgi:uncharacterized membrane protein YkvA (DUF1232 family)